MTGSDTGEVGNRAAHSPGSGETEVRRYGAHLDQSSVTVLALSEPLTPRFCPRMPFCLSSSDAGLVNLPLPLRNEREHLTCDVAFEAPDGLQLGMTFGKAFGHVRLRPRIRPQPADGDDVQRAVGRPIPASVEPITHRLSRRGGHGADSA